VSSVVPKGIGIGTVHRTNVPFAREEDKTIGRTVKTTWTFDNAQAVAVYTMSVHPRTNALLSPWQNPTNPQDL